EERFSLAMRGANEGLWDWDLLTNTVDYSSRWKSMLGYAENELENKFATWEQLVHPDDIEHAKQVIDSYLNRKISKYELEYRMHHKDGHWIDILSRGFGVQHESSGEIIRFIGTHVDITQHKLAELSLLQSEQDFKELFSGNKCVELIIDPNDGSIIEANRAAEKFYGYNRDQLLSLKISDINILSDEQIHLEMEYANQQKNDHFIFKHQLANGDIKDVEVYSGPIHWNKKKALYSIVHDISSRKQAEEKVRTLIQAIEQSPVSVMITNPQGKIEYVNGTFEHITGYSMAEVRGQNPRILKSGNTSSSIYRELWESLTKGESWQGDFQNKKKNGDLFWEHAQIAPVLSPSGMVEHYVGVKEDITQHKIQEEKIIHQAHFDSLTDLPNRFLCLDRLSQLINEAKRNSEHVAVLFMDLDDFKKVNDSLGHETGDKLLIEASARLLHEIRSGDTVGRLGGDEFLLLLGGIKTPDHAQIVASNILDSFRAAFQINDRDLILTASIGIALYPEDGINTSELLRNADTAMYHAKDRGRNTYSFFTEEMNREITRRLTLEEQMLGALEREEFSVVYQPQMEVSTGKLMGAEALMRWTNPLLGNVSPAEFIPVAEKSGLIIKLGQYILEQALQQVTDWQQHSTDFRIAINLSPRQFRDPGLVDNIRQLLEQTGVDACHLDLEITEGVLMSGHDYINKSLGDLSSMGINISMDDFGTGYSSLSYLRSYPFNILKIDQSFIRDISVDPADRALINATIAMSHGLNLKVVAEGVETQEQLDYLKQLNCDYAQGYLFSKPITADNFIRLLKNT
ncbi:MAG: EAL domain-containing protein, partial [Gammaproteobacteria bacterium]|nr:EAL domain-containing protein [Gammaproteobacteria bacterium]